MTESHEHTPVHSIWPLLLAAGITLLMVGIVTSLVVSIVGVVAMLVALGGWTQQNRTVVHPVNVDEEDGRHE